MGTVVKAMQCAYISEEEFLSHRHALGYFAPCLRDEDFLVNLALDPSNPVASGGLFISIDEMAGQKYFLFTISHNHINRFMNIILFNRF